MDQCPACGASVEAEEFCPWCGLALSGPEAYELRTLVHRLATIDYDVYQLSRERDEVATELHNKRFRASRGAVAQMPIPTVRTPAPAAARRTIAPPKGGRAEWNVDRVRSVLLWVGAALLAASALTFTAVAWTRLGDGGRAALLFGFTGVAIFLALATRTRLPATAEAFTALSIAMALVDWVALRRAGFAPGLTTTTWWAFGSAIIGLASVALGEVAAPNVGRRTAGLLLPISGVLTIVVTAGTLWSLGLGLALLAAAILVVNKNVRGDDVLREMLAAAAIMVWIAGAITTAIAATRPDTLAAAILPALAVLALGVAPALLARRELVVGAVLGALVTLAAPLFGNEGLITFAAVAGGLTVATMPWMPASWRNAVLAGGVYAIPGVAGLAAVSVVTTFAPLAWFKFHWTGSLQLAADKFVNGPQTQNFEQVTPLVLVIAGVVVGALLALSLPPRRVLAAHVGVPIAVAVAVAGACMAPIVFGASVLLAFIVALSLGALLLIAAAMLDAPQPRFGLAVLGIAPLALIPAAGWAAMTPYASIAALIVAMVAGAAAAVIARSAIQRSVLAAFASVSAIGLAAVWTAFAGVSAAEVGFVAVSVAGLAFVFGAWMRRGAPEGLVLEVIGIGGMVVGGVAAAGSLVWLAAALSVAAPYLALVALRPDRRVVSGSAAAVAALSALAAWLVYAGVSSPEVGFITTAVAGLLFLFGALVRRTEPEGVALEAIGVGAMAVGGVASAGSLVWLAAGLTVATPYFVLAALRRDRAIAYASGAALTALGALAAWLAYAGVTPPAIGFATTAAAGLVLAFGAVLRQDALEGVALEAIGVSEMMIGAVVAASSPHWLAATLSIAVPFFVLAALRRDRVLVYGAAAAGAALGATWAWLAVADVHVVEAYTLPAAAVALGAGLVGWKRGPGRSWLMLAPAIVLGLGPTLEIAVRENDPLRTILAAAAAVAILLLGSARRLQAPIVLGSAALLVLAIDTFGPAAARLPRWVPLALAGVILMWVGAKFERSREAVHRASETFQHFG